MKLVVGSCPKNFHIMQLAIQFAKKHIPDIDQVVISWDDGSHWFADGKMGQLSEHAIIRDLPNQIKQVLPDSEILLLSENPDTQDEVLGWLRQQYQILNMHKYISDDSWVFLCADTIIRNDKVFKRGDTTLFYSDQHDLHHRYLPYYDFINHVTGHTYDPAMTYMCHFYYVERDVLVSLDQFVRNKHNSSLVDVFKQFHRSKLDSTYAWPTVPPLADNELYGIYASNVMSKKFEFPEHNFVSVANNYFIEKFNKTTYDVECSSADDLPESFYNRFGIEYNGDLATALGYSNRRTNV